jgi:hypothetical protein
MKTMFHKSRLNFIRNWTHSRKGNKDSSSFFDDFNNPANLPHFKARRRIDLELRLKCE